MVLTLARVIRLCAYTSYSVFISIIMLAEGVQARAQIPAADTFRLRVRPGASGDASVSDPANMWIIAFLCLTLLVVVVATLWPNETKENPYQRQRKYARVDQIYFKVRAQILSNEEAASVLRETRTAQPASLPWKPEAALPMTVLSLGLSGCSFATPLSIPKGAVILFDLASLPDFPLSQETLVAGKVVWTRVQRQNLVSTEMVGTKFVAFGNVGAAEALKQYLNFLLDDPMT